MKCVAEEPHSKCEVDCPTCDDPRNRTEEPWLTVVPPLAPGASYVNEPMWRGRAGGKRLRHLVLVQSSPAFPAAR